MRIVKSLLVIFAVGALAAGATTAIFTSRATLENNTFSTGILEIRINGKTTAPGFTYDNAAPGQVFSNTFTVMNYGPPWFLSGPSTLPAKELAVKAQKTSGDSGLYNQLMIDLYANANWSGCSSAGVTFVAGKGCLVYSGYLKNLNGATDKDILHATQWGAHPDLIPGNSLKMTMDVSLSASAPSSLMGKTTVFDVYVDGYNPHR
jgi:predicted ribosomally synthesized peptide with SipW-like signal peptide